MHVKVSYAQFRKIAEQGQSNSIILEGKGWLIMSSGALAIYAPKPTPAKIYHARFKRKFPAKNSFPFMRFGTVGIHTVEDTPCDADMVEHLLEEIKHLTPEQRTILKDQLSESEKL